MLDHYGAAIAGLDDTLNADLRVRARVARTERPTVVIELIGERPLARPGGGIMGRGRRPDRPAPGGLMDIERDARKRRPVQVQFEQAAFRDSQVQLEAAIRGLENFDDPRPTPCRSTPGISIDI